MADFPPCDDVCGALEQHVRNFFDGHEIQAFTWTSGPILEQNPHFRVFRVAPSNPKGLWTYVSVGGWAATEAENVGTEFILCTAIEDIRAVELLAMTVFYHREGKLGLGHTLPLGEPWMAGSQCDHFLVSLPYPFGPDLEIAHVGDRHVEFLWLLPITKAERDLKVADGVEALESRFEDTGLRYWEIDRASIV
ncbi:MULTISPECIES: suppressor of fused domain protein [unclassified Arthrobacter]|uniref:suppressor of fused domain protein n=1 Tax=unclassified Arthrobacter TaxID=235627 RepID=UPI001486DB2C|nr:MULTISPECIES: suppressor of fused domain protein [unclassified Arthrobacter]